MRKTTAVTVSLLFVLSLMLAMAGEGLAAEQTTLTGTIHCIDISGKLHVKAGVCPADHIAHVIITDDGRAVMLGGGEKMEALIRNLAIPAGTKVGVRGGYQREFSAMEVEEIIMSVGAAGP